MNHVKEGKYINMNVSKNSSGGLNYENVWQTLSSGILNNGKLKHQQRLSAKPLVNTNGKRWET